MSFVCGKEIWFDEDSINKLLGTPTPLVCGVDTRRADLEDLKDVEEKGFSEEIKNELCVEGASWLKQTEGILPTKFSMKDMKPMAKAWGSFVVHTLEVVGWFEI